MGAVTAPMEQRPLGRTGADVSVVGLGTWQLGGDWGDVDDQTAADVLDAALDAGVTLLDTADVYGDGRSEDRIRQALRHAVRSALRRDQGRPTGRPLRGGPVHPGEPARVDRPVPAQPRRRHPRPGAAALPAPRRLLRRAGVRHARGVGGRAGDRRLRGLGRDGRRGADGAATPGRRVRSRSSSTSSGASRWRSCCPAAATAQVAILARVPLASGLLTGKYDRVDDVRPPTTIATSTGTARRSTWERRSPASPSRSASPRPGSSSTSPVIVRRAPLRAALGHPPARGHRRHPGRP